MHEIFGDLFDSVLAEAICITTNGFLNHQRANPMGRGCAGEAKRRWPGIQMVVGNALYHRGNNTRLLTNELRTLVTPGAWGDHVLPYHLLMFPTKPGECTREELLPHYRAQAQNEAGGTYPGWMAKSDLGLIERSAKQLLELTDLHNFKSVVLPWPGIGNGGLDKDQVREVISPILDSRFYVISFK